MTQALFYGGYNYVIVSLEVTLASEGDTGTGYFADVDFKYTDSKEIQQFIFHYIQNLNKLTTSFSLAS